MSHQSDIVSTAVADSKDKRTRRILWGIVALVILMAAMTAWATITVFKRTQSKAEAGQDLASQVQVACTDGTPNDASLQKLCNAASQVIQKGAPGDQGPPGPQGPQGPPGVDGNDGKNGTNGKNGQNGTNGVDGQNGIAGKDGATGPQGPKGDPGTNGKDGTNGIDAVPFTFSFTVNGPGNQEATYTCTINAPDTTATCTKTS